jgi:protein-S-isoprenylcysteine O-methyltransferase Ste14
MLILLALGMLFLTIFIPVVNPTNKPIPDLIPIIIMCAAICLVSIALIVYFVIPKKMKDKTTTLNNSEKLLWEGKTSKIGGIMFSAKIFSFLVLLFEIIFVVIAVFFDIGLSDKLKTFFVLQSFLITLLVIFFVMCFQSTNFYYKITNERVYLYFSNIPTIYEIKDILTIKIKYAFYERNKQFGTIKVKVKNKRIAPMRNHLYSIPQPQEVFDILQNCINNQAKQKDYQAEVF